jgi:rRNA maturation protein Rpf1
MQEQFKQNIQGQNCFFCKIWGYKTFLIRKIKIKTKKISKSLGIKVYIISKSFHALIFFNISDIQLTKWICNGKNVIYRVDVKIKIVNGCSQQKKKHKNV